MIRRILSAAAVLAWAVVAFASQDATLVLRNGERVSGQLSYKGGNEITLHVNGQDRSYSFNDVAIVAFVAGDPTAAELRQLPDNDNVPELERNAVVMRDGRVIRGKLHGFSPDGTRVTFDSRRGGAGGRRDFGVDQIWRVYLSPAGARSVYNNILNGPSAPAPSQPAVPTAVPTSGTAIVVNANQPWTDTGIAVNRGDRITFNASGEIRILSGDSPDGLATPDGAARFTKPENAPYPVRGMNAGGLIGRIDNGEAFVIGSNTRPIRMPATGRLYLGINDDNMGDNQGNFRVTITR